MDLKIKKLYDRLDDSNKQLLYVLDNAAIDELINNGIIDKIDPDKKSPFYDENETTRSIRRTELVRRIAGNNIVYAVPNPNKDRSIGYLMQVNYDEHIPYVLAVGIQGVLEDIYSTGDTKNREYNLRIIVNQNKKDVRPLIDVIELFKNFYDTINIGYIVLTPKDKKKKKARFQKLKIKLGLISAIMEKEEEEVIKTPEMIYKENYLDIIENLKDNPKGQEIFKEAVKLAEDEVISQSRLYIRCAGASILEAEWKEMSDEDKFACMTKLGEFGVEKKLVIEVKYVEEIPYCNAVNIFIKSRELFEENRTQLIEIKGSGDKDKFVEVLNQLKECDSKWNYKIF